MLNQKQKKFLKEVKSILWEKWDPIGVNDGENEWNDEYDSYAPHIFRLALEGKDATHIAMSLSTAAETSMGLSPAQAHDLEIAKIIIKRKEELFP